MSFQNKEALSNVNEALQNLPSSHLYTKEQLELVYSIAYGYATQNHFEEALPFFAFLTQYAPTTKHFLTGLGLCLQRLERYADAIQVYSFIGTIYPDSPESSVQVAECLISQNRHEEALEVLNIVNRFYSHQKQKNAIQVRAKALTELLNSKFVSNN